MKTIKLTIILIICSILVLEGCYSYFTFNNENGLTIPPQNNSILIYTVNGQIIEVEPYHFVEVREAANFVYGVGERAENNSKDFKPFRGKFHPISKTTEVATVIPIGWYETVRAPRLVFTLEDSSIVKLMSSDCIVVDSFQGIGLWYTRNEREELHGTQFSGRIPFEEIKSIEVRKISAIKMLALISGIVAVPVIIFLTTFHYTMNWNDTK